MNIKHHLLNMFISQQYILSSAGHIQVTLPYHWQVSSTLLLSTSPFCHTPGKTWASQCLSLQFSEGPVYSSFCSHPGLPRRTLCPLELSTSHKHSPLYLQSPLECDLYLLVSTENWLSCEDTLSPITFSSGGSSLFDTSHTTGPGSTLECKYPTCTSLPLPNNSLSSPWNPKLWIPCYQTVESTVITFF